MGWLPIVDHFYDRFQLGWVIESTTKLQMRFDEGAVGAEQIIGVQADVTAYFEEELGIFQLVVQLDISTVHSSKIFTLDD